MVYWRRPWQPTPAFLPGESHGQRSLAGYSPKGRKESTMTEYTHVQVPGLLDRLSIWKQLGPYFHTAMVWALLAVFHYSQLACLFRVLMWPPKHLIYILILRFCLYFPPSFLESVILFLLEYSSFTKGARGSVLKNLPATRETWVQPPG